MISRALSLKSALARVVKPLGIDKRLIFMHGIDEHIPPCEWLVVKVKLSRQQALFEDWIDQLEQDLEARREAVAALNLARIALNALRRLAAVVRLTPVQFHEVLQNPDPQEKLGIHWTQDWYATTLPMHAPICASISPTAETVTLNSRRVSWSASTILAHVSTHSCLESHPCLLLACRSRHFTSLFDNRSMR
jgi:hypothetical protein